MRTKMFAVLTVLITLCAVAVSAASSADLLSGTWNVNVSKSSFNPGPAPKSHVAKVTAVPNGMKVIEESVDATGAKARGEYTVKFDGKDYPDKFTVDGKPSTALDGISAKKIDDYNIQLTYKAQGKAVLSVNIVIAKDDKTLTATRTNAGQGQAIKDTIIFEKQ